MALSGYRQDALSVFWQAPTGWSKARHKKKKSHL